MENDVDQRKHFSKELYELCEELEVDPRQYSNFTDLWTAIVEKWELEEIEDVLLMVDEQNRPLSTFMQNIIEIIQNRHDTIRPPR